MPFLAAEPLPPAEVRPTHVYSPVPATDDFEVRDVGTKNHRLRKAKGDQPPALIYSGILVDAIMATYRGGTVGDAVQAKSLLAMGVREAGFKKSIEIDTAAIRITTAGEPGERGVYFQYRRLS
jgi:hypothetical protein